MCLKSRCSWSLCTLSGYVLLSIVKVWTLKSRIKSAIIMLHSDVHPSKAFPTWCGLMCMAGVCRCGLVAHKSKMPDDARWVMIVQVETPSHWLPWGWYPHLPIGRMSRANGAGQFPPMFFDGANIFSFLIGKTKQHGPRVKCLFYIIWMVYRTRIPGQIGKMHGRSWHTGAIMIFRLRFLWGSFPVEWPWFIDFNRGAASASVEWNIHVLHDKLYQIVINCPSGPPAAIKHSTIANFKCWYSLQINDQTAVSTKNAIRLPCSKMSHLDPIHDVKLPWHCPCRPSTVPRWRPTPSTLGTVNASISCLVVATQYENPCWKYLLESFW